MLETRRNHAGRIIATGWLAVFAGSAFACHAHQSASAPAGSTIAADAPAAAPPALDPLIDKILTRLEQREVESLQAAIRWRLHYVTDDPKDDVARVGLISYKKDRPVAKFLIDFRRRIVGTTAQDLAEQHLFDGVWYVKLDEQTRSVERRQVRRPDDASDPFKLGEGPFPIPFGQSKEAILREFTVTRVEPAEDDPPGTDHLKLVPHPGGATAEKYKYVHFWIAREGVEAGLPIKVRAGKLKPTGQLDADITVTFTEPKLNPGLSGSIFKIDTPAGYAEATEELAAPQPPESP